MQRFFKWQKNKLPTNQPTTHKRGEG